MTLRRRAAAILLLLACGVQAQDAPPPPKDYSPAERLLFMTDQLGNVKPPATLTYTFRKTGTLEPGFDDRIVLALKAGADGRCCAARTDFLTAERKLQLPEVPSAEGNPVLLHFLEREVREMQRLTRGSQSHFRKRLRMTIYQGATVTPVSLRFRGRNVAGQEVTIRPYLDDPNRPKYEDLAQKEYRFVLSSAVPGGLYAIRTRVAGPAGAAVPLLAEELTIAGAEPAAAQNETTR